MRIIGIDPGLNHTGWAVLELNKQNASLQIASGSISPNPKLKMQERLAFIHKEISRIIETYNPNCAALEEIFVNINPKSTLALSFARGVTMASIGLHNLSLFECAPNKVKKTITGNGKADKEQVMKMLKIIIPNATYKTSDEADAIAIAYTGIIYRESRAHLQNICNNS